MFIEPIPPEAAVGVLAQIYESEEERWGFAPNLVQVFSHRPSAYEAWMSLVAEVYRGMDRRRCELATLAAARALKSTCCSVAHGKTLRDRFYPTEQVIAIASTRQQAGLDDVDVAIMDLAEKVAVAPSSVEPNDVARLKSFGLSDRDVFDVVFAVAARAFLVTVVEGLGMSPEQPFLEDLEPELLEVLEVGRPVPRT